jgi:hypothetical protein
MLLPLHSLRRLAPRTAWLLIAVDIIQYGGIALVAIPLGIAVYLVTSAILASRGSP